MDDPVTRPSPELARRVGHETTDVSPFYVSLFALGLVLMIALVLPLLSWLLGRFEAAAVRHDPRQSQLTGDQTPPSPRLQSKPADELARWRDEENRRLSHYGWIDAKRGVVRIPVDRAIEILATRGLPEPEGPVEIAPKQKERVP